MGEEAGGVVSEQGGEPSRCPVCRTPVAPGAARCMQCGRVLGEADRCPHCGAVAGAERASDGSLRCAACGRPRRAEAGLTVRGERADLGPGGIRRPRGLAVRGLVGLLKAAGVGLGALGLGVTALLAFFANEGHGLIWALGTAVSLLLLGAGWGLGMLVDRWSLEKEALRQRRLLEEVAEREGGHLTVRRAADVLGVSEREADALLMSWVDGERVRVELDEEHGLVSYAFGVRERPLRVRVDATPSEARAAEPPEGDARALEGEHALKEAEEAKRPGSLDTGASS